MEAYEAGVSGTTTATDPQSRKAGATLLEQEARAKKEYQDKVNKARLRMLQAVTKRY